jgi:hypothetical protein
MFFGAAHGYSIGADVVSDVISDINSGRDRGRINAVTPVDAARRWHAGIHTHRCTWPDTDTAA